MIIAGFPKLFPVMSLVNDRDPPPRDTRKTIVSASRRPTDKGDGDHGGDDDGHGH